MEHTRKATTVIAPTRGWIPLRLREVWEHRELLYFLTLRDIKVRYKQTWLGVGWAVVQPLVAMVIFSVIFGHLARLPSDDIPYPLLTFAGVLPWQFFASSVGKSSGSVVAGRGLVTKVYFPRLVIPVASTLASGVDFLIAFVILIGIMAYFTTAPALAVLLLPLFLLMAWLTALGVGLWLSAINTRYRDVSIAIPFLIQIWMYASPVAYSSTLVPEHWRIIYGINPMSGVIEGFRWSLLGASWEPGPLIGVSAGVCLFVLVSGAYYFRRMEKTFADVI